MGHGMSHAIMIWCGVEFLHHQGRDPFIPLDSQFRLSSPVQVRTDSLAGNAKRCKSEICGPRCQINFRLFLLTCLAGF
ncbi:hypothetical protein RRG08_022128 [Elysia crispata]|uniref:Uncharacterized protein n=1 Tax=Elysia crispata TaxID=231223 RepID=A0AAE0Y0H0_9GAST|nr:hypothetical protein RRG08_022128 [Elysia crispata]